uniref:Lcl C-terminal domain-containing protein n=1 Tax=Ningiella ruwaisensis TaxID=2364274 RepID=UPI001445F403|nr:DUF1566 domain-containing protein [Ningiella ruwaisensis]
MIKRWLWVSLWAVLAFISYRSEAESLCPAAIPETANGNLYEELGEGEILHLPSDLVFMRCSLGQTWQNGACIGEADTFTWQEALQISIGYDYADSQNWRLPNVKELSVIAERACVRPAINEEAFPSTPADDFWTSTVSVQTQSGQSANGAWSVAFFNGTTSLRNVERNLHVRLVRTR